MSEKGQQVSDAAGVPVMGLVAAIDAVNRGAGAVGRGAVSAKNFIAEKERQFAEGLRTAGGAARDFIGENGPKFAEGLKTAAGAPVMGLVAAINAIDRGAGAAGRGAVSAKNFIAEKERQFAEGLRTAGGAARDFISEKGPQFASAAGRAAGAVGRGALATGNLAGRGALATGKLAGRGALAIGNLAGIAALATGRAAGGAAKRAAVSAKDYMSEKGHQAIDFIDEKRQQVADAAGVPVRGLVSAIDAVNRGAAAAGRGAVSAKNYMSEKGHQFAEGVTENVAAAAKDYERLLLGGNNERFNKPIPKISLSVRKPPEPDEEDPDLKLLVNEDRNLLSEPEHDSYAKFNPIFNIVNSNRKYKTKEGFPQPTAEAPTTENANLSSHYDFLLNEINRAMRNSKKKSLLTSHLLNLRHVNPYVDDDSQRFLKRNYRKIGGLPLWR
jgi:hypothetical protein